MQKILTKYIYILGDTLIVPLCLWVALLLRFDIIPEAYWTPYITHVGFITLIHIGVFAFFGIYRILWRYASIRELMKLGMATLFSIFIFFTYSIYTFAIFPRSVYIIYSILLLLSVLFSRLGHRLLSYHVHDLKNYFTKNNTLTDHTKVRTMLIGAGEAASIVLHDLQNNPTSSRQILIAVDDDPKKIGSHLHGVPIKGTTLDIPKLAKDYEIAEILIAMPSVSKDRIAEILSFCNATSCKLKMFKGLERTFDNKGELKNIQDVSIEDLLGREEITLEAENITETIKDKVILVTGGGGSIGSELCRQIISYHPKLLIIFDIYENNAYDLYHELLRHNVPAHILKIIIGSVRDEQKLDNVFKTYHPHLIFHAAAHKHVPLMEDCPEEAVKNNIFGTLNVALCARSYKAEKFILLSTDKAVNPTNVMGATKRVCEMIIQSIDRTTTDTDFVAVRFGNVLGSNGSVIPLFKKQIAEGGPLTVTHPDIIRYFMTIPEAVSLILQSMTFAQGGEIFVLDMGKPVKILDLAKNLIKLSGLEEGKDIEIEFTGLRPGEKLYEELLMAEEGLRSTRHRQIFVARPMEMEFEHLKNNLFVLGTALKEHTSVKDLLSQLVPSYTHKQDIA